MVDYKELYEIQLNYINSEKEAELVYKTLVSLNKKLKRYDNSRIKNSASNSAGSNDLYSKIKNVINDIFDNYNEYNALDKREIQETLSTIQKISYNHMPNIEQDIDNMQDYV